MDRLPIGAGVLLIAGTVGVLGCANAARVVPTSGGDRLTGPDSSIVGRILLAEDRRDSTDAAIADGEKHGDARVRLLARRARARIRDPRFTSRDSFPVANPTVTWPEPSWKIRYRALTTQSGCDALRTALGDEVWPVRLRAASLVTSACGTDGALVATLRRWVETLPADASRRARDGVAWQGGAFAIVALSRATPTEARPPIRALATHGEWHVRRYAAIAAGIVSDTATLRTLARDANDNVREAAIESLAKVTPSDPEPFLAALEGTGAQSVRAGAVALKAIPGPRTTAAANAAFERWVSRPNASERDVRIALLDAAGKPASDDRPPRPTVELPSRAVALALGADVRLRVVMADASGGGSFIVRLRGDAAPTMAARILALVRGGYYDGLDWHRVEHDFVIQGGSPGSNEYVGLPRYLRDELGGMHHLRGTVGMSTRGHDTGDAQWFVNLKDNLRLDRDYTVFAEVVEGMDVVDRVLEGDVIARIEEIRR